MCALPAHWNPARRQWDRYCHGKHCSNPEHLCRACGAPFSANVGPAGTKYCSIECKRRGYGEARNPGQVQCAWCNAWATNPGSRGVWPYICADCLDPIRHVIYRLRRHHVPHERARKLTIDPGCEICGTNVVEPVRISSAAIGPLLVVDHDHGCCPFTRSCGRCVRGLICVNCNSAEGMLGGDPSKADALAEYMRRWGSG